MLYPALVDVDGRVDMKVLPPGPAAVAQHRVGVRRLLMKALPQQVALVRDRTLAERELVLGFHGIGATGALVDDVLCAAAEQAFALDPPIRTQVAFDAALRKGRSELVAAADGLRALLTEVLPLYRKLRRDLEAADTRSEAVRADIAHSSMR